MRRRQWAVLASVPLLLSGCGVLGLSAPGGSGGSPATSPTAPSWIVVDQGSASPSPTPSAGAGRPTPAATAGFLPLRPAAPAGTPSVSCSANTFNFSKIDAADVVPATTTAVVTWYNVGGFNLKQFRLTAISQDLVGGKQRDVGFTVVAPTTPCGRMSATVTGLDRKTGYVFSVDAVVYRKSGDGTRAATVARSHVIYTG
jgi:hypothetical protein